MSFQLKSLYQPSGDQPQAINQLVAGINSGHSKQTLLGVTGSGKTFTIANVIAKTQMPTLVISHNKTLAAQLYQEFKEFFPNNGVGFFISYYDCFGRRYDFWHDEVFSQINWKSSANESVAE